MRSMSKRAAAVCLVSVALLASCGGRSSPKPRQSTAPTGEGTVTGILHLSGGPAPGSDSAAVGEVYAFTSAMLTGRPRIRAKTGSDGSFSLNLPAGTYYLAATSPSFSIDPPPPATPPCRGDRPAVVSGGRTSRVDVVCQMK
jgi:hypothetical protein